jgi:hypothetical protein
MNEWINVEDRLPTKKECEKNNGWFLVWYDGFSRANMSRYDGYEEEQNYEHHKWKYLHDHIITHWMELPEAPK